MSAFFLAINRDKSTFEQAVAKKMMSAIDVFGHDQARLVVQDNYALGYQSHWSVPEEVGECQPLLNERQDVWSLFHGRLDNREVLIEALSGDTSLSNKRENSQLSDAWLMQLFYQQFGERRLREVVGPFAFVAFNTVNGDVFAARDGMGGRNLLYRITDQYVLIATYEMALVAHPSVEYTFNHARLARAVGRLLEDRLSSSINGITPLEPGTSIHLHGDKQQPVIENRFYSFDASKRTVLENDQAYADQFKALLAQAVERRGRSVGSVGSMLSGGYDSVPISILAAKYLSKKEQQLTAFSWVFDRYSEVDERYYSAPVCQDFNIKQVCINCDDVWPKFDDTMYFNPVMPFVTPYIELQKVALKKAKDSGVKIVLSGVHGDLLYGYTDSILWELIKAKRWRDACSEALHRYKKSSGIISCFKQYVLRPMPWVQTLLEKRRLKRQSQCDWLSSNMLEKLESKSSKLWSQSIKSLRPIGYQLVFGGFAGEDIAHGRHIDACYGLERRYPFRDRDLCEFMLSIPSDQLNLFSINRPLIKKAFAQEFRSELLLRNKKTSFYPVIKEGIKNDENYLKWFNSEHKYWSFYVKKCHFNTQGVEHAGIDIVKWQCGYYDYWKSVCYDQVVNKLGLNNE